MGCSSKYCPEYAAGARNYCLLGVMNDDFFQLFGVNVSPIRAWTKRQSAFAEGGRDGKIIATSAVGSPVNAIANGAE